MLNFYRIQILVSVVTAETSTAFLTVWIIDEHAGHSLPHWWWSEFYDLNVAGIFYYRFLLNFVWNNTFCFSLFDNPEIAALNPEPGGQRSKPGDSRSNPEGWQSYVCQAALCLSKLVAEMCVDTCRKSCCRFIFRVWLSLLQIFLAVCVIFSCRFSRQACLQHFWPSIVGVDITVSVWLIVPVLVSKLVVVRRRLRYVTVLL